MMHVSHRGLQLIKQAEGFSPTRYRCPAGRPTIGYGHVIRNRDWAELANATLTDAQATDLLIADLSGFESLIDEHVTVPLTQGQFDALASIIMNVGPGAPGIRDGIVWLMTGSPSTLLRKLNTCDYAGAAAEFPRWCHVRGQTMPGLVERRQAERELFESEDKK